MSRAFIIYGLVDPRNGHLRYIGKSCSGIKRPSASYLRSIKGHEGRTYKANWILGLHRMGLRPQVVVIQEFDTPDILSQAEMHWISYFRKSGHPLTNLTDGGEGSSGHKKTAATIQRMRAGAYRRWGRSNPLDEKAVVETYLTGKTLRAVAGIFGTSSSMVFQILKRHEVKVRPKLSSGKFKFVPGQGMVAK